MDHLKYFLKFVYKDETTDDGTTEYVEYIEPLHIYDIHWHYVSMVICY